MVEPKCGGRVRGLYIHDEFQRSQRQGEDMGQRGVWGFKSLLS